MLLAGLKGQHEATVAFGINGLANEAARHLADEGVGRTEIADVRTAIREGNTQTLRIATGYIGTPAAGRLKCTQSYGHGIDGEEGLVGVALVGQSREIFNNAVAVGLWHDDASHIVGLKERLQGFAIRHTVLGRQHHEVNAMEMGIGANNIQHGGQEGFGDNHAIALLGCSHAHHHGLGRCRCAIVHRGVGHIHIGQARHQGLILENVLQGSLRNLCLIRSVGGRELGAGSDIRNHGGGIVVVSTSSCKDAEGFVLIGQSLQLTTHLHLGHRMREVQGARQFEFLGHLGIEVVQGFYANDIQHLLNIIGGMGKVFHIL